MERHRGAMATTVQAGFDMEREPPGFEYSRAIDGLLSSLFLAATTRHSWRASLSGLSMSAVGSYGRRALSLQSDFDIRLLAEDESQAQAIAENIAYPLWDAGVAIGHQVVTIEKVIALAKTDLPTATSLLDWRPIAGDDSLPKRLEERAFATVFAKETVDGVLEELRCRADERVARFGGSVYLLEPDVRNGAGGMRDFDVIQWTARARWGVSKLSELLDLGVLIQPELAPIERASRFLAHVRNLLHGAAGRRNDRLSFDRQELVADAMGYGDDGPGVERFMSDYYRHARALTQARDMMFLRAQTPPSSSGPEVNVKGGLKVIGENLAFLAPPEDDPAVVFRIYSEALKREALLHPQARAQIARLTLEPAFCEQLRANEEAARLFVRLTCSVATCAYGHNSILTELHDVGLLLAMIPELTPVVGRVHHDIYHVYTVDVHSIKAVDRLRELARGELAVESPVASHLAIELARPTVLFLATLLHDVGKDIGGKNHCDRGAELIVGILERLRLSPKDIREAQHLVRKHLVMYHVATRRDIEDPMTIEAFCREVHGHEGLRELFLLTLCDVGTTSPEALTSWKARMLDELYLAAESFLSHATVDVVEARENALAEVLRRANSAAEAAQVKQVLCALPERYVLANDPSRIMQHARFVVEHAQSSLQVAAVSMDLPYAEFAFLADDRKGLLALVAASIAAAQVQVVAAQVYSFIDETGRPRALDLFWVDAGERVKTGKTLALRFERHLQSLLEEGVAPRSLLNDAPLPGGKWVSRVTPAVATHVSIDNRGATRETIVEVITRDRAGLLFELADAIQEQGFAISLAKINTEGHQVADVFYVTESTGGKVTDPLRLEALKGRILAAVGSN